MTTRSVLGIFRPLLTLVCASCLFYGCTRETASPDSALHRNKTETEQVQSTQSPQSSQPSQNAPSSQTTPNTTGIGSSNVADLLSSATDEFAGVFQDGSVPATAKQRELEVAADIKEKYSFAVRPEIVAKIDKATQHKDASAKTYLLQHKFAPKETLRWDVVHRIRKNVTFAGKTQAIETESRTIRRWNILGELGPDKHLCEHVIEQMVLTQQEEGKEPITYDSRKDKVVPRVFAMFGTDKTVATVLERFQIDGAGVMTSKKKLVPEFHGLETDSKMLVPFPTEPVAVGESWTIPFTIFLKNRDETFRSCQAIQKFTLDRVEGDLAVIRFRTILMSIVTDPVLEGQLAEKLYEGRALFEIKQGRVVETELDFSHSIANAMGESSHLEYYCHLTEKLLKN